MCGISGRVNHHFDAPVEVDLIRQMGTALTHRGPDDGGIFANGHVGLAHRRLSIIDLSPDGAQPMSNEDGSVWIVFNGEIYNFLELRKDLISKGHCFRSKSDTEVIVHLYEERGPEVVHALRGMFALAIWDAKRKQLLLARDRLGKKPLYYYTGPTAFVFASELQSLFVDPDVPRVPNFEAIRYYLTYRYVPSPLSAFQGIYKLPPAHYLVLKDGQCRTERYWEPHYTEKLTEPEAVLSEQLRDHLGEAVRLRMISDVPIGAFLSGGLDSSAIVALMSQLSDRPVKTFSIGFEDEAFSELPYARTIAQYFNSDHHEFVVQPDAVAILPQLVRHFGEPFADSTAVPQYYLSKMAREFVTVVLAGDGGDEAFGGYQRYASVLVEHVTDYLPRSLKNGLATAIQKLSMATTNPLPLQVSRLLRALSDDPQRRYARWMSHFNLQQQAALFSGDFLRQVHGVNPEELIVDAYRATDARHLLDATLGVDVRTYLPDDLLVKVDITSMANSLEVRAPLLDHPLMEFAAALPPSLKIQGREKKYLLKRAMADLIPEEILNRPKQGFVVPVERWFRADLKEMAYDTLLDARSMGRGYFKPKAVKRLLDEHASGACNWQRQLWTLLMLELWHRAFVDQ